MDKSSIATRAVNAFIPSNDVRQIVASFLTCEEHVLLGMTHPIYKWACCRRCVQLTAISHFFDRRELYISVAAKPWYNPLYDLGILIRESLRRDDLSAIKWFYSMGVINEEFDTWSDRPHYEMKKMEGGKVTETKTHGGGIIKLSVVEDPSVKYMYDAKQRDDACKYTFASMHEHTLPGHYSNFIAEGCIPPTGLCIERVLHEALHLYSVKIIKWLLQNTDISDVDLFDLIFAAVACKNVDVFKDIYNIVGIPETVDIDALVSTAVYTGAVEVIRYIIDIALQYDEFDHNEPVIASGDMNVEVVDLVCSLVDMSRVDIDKLLTEVIDRGDIDIFKYIYESNLIDQSDISDIHISNLVALHMTSMMDYLCTNGDDCADTYAKLLTYANGNGYMSEVKHLISLNVDAP